MNAQTKCFRRAPLGTSARTLISSRRSFALATGSPIFTSIRRWRSGLNSAARRLEIVSPLANGVPSFLLHVAPQVSIIQSTCTDYLDGKAGITRAKAEILQKRIGLVSRRMGRAQSQAAIQAFLSKDQERTTQAFLAKLESLREKAGRPDSDSISDPAAFAQKWASEFKFNKEEPLARMLAHLETFGDQEGT